jgi:hypothetical protein
MFSSCGLYGAVVGLLSVTLRNHASFQNKRQSA